MVSSSYDVHKKDTRSQYSQSIFIYLYKLMKISLSAQGLSLVLKGGKLGRQVWMELGSSLTPSTQTAEVSYQKAQQKIFFKNEKGKRKKINQRKKCSTMLMIHSKNASKSVQTYASRGEEKFLGISDYLSSHSLERGGKSKQVYQSIW